jgi:hypothetical protein
MLNPNFHHEAVMWCKGALSPGTGAGGIESGKVKNVVTVLTYWRAKMAQRKLKEA